MSLWSLGILPFSALNIQLLVLNASEVIIDKGFYVLELPHCSSQNSSALYPSNVFLCSFAVSSPHLPISFISTLSCRGGCNKNYPACHWCFQYHQGHSYSSFSHLSHCLEYVKTSSASSWWLSIQKYQPSSINPCNIKIESRIKPFQCQKTPL